MAKTASCRVSDLSELMNGSLCAEASFYRRHALMIGATTSDCEPPQIRHPHLSRARDRGIVKPRPRKWAVNLGAAASGLSARRHVGTRLVRSVSAPSLGAAPNGLIDPPSGASSPQAKSPGSRDSSPAPGSIDSSPRSPLKPPEPVREAASASTEETPRRVPLLALWKVPKEPPLDDPPSAAATARNRGSGLAAGSAHSSPRSPTASSPAARGILKTGGF